MKQAVPVCGWKAPQWVPLDEYSIRQNFRHFLNLLNRRVFGKAAQRYGKQVYSLGVIEGGEFKRLHYHALIDCPRREQIADFGHLIEECWRSTQWGYEEWSAPVKVVRCLS